MTRYALIGAAGYVAPKHFNAIRETGGEFVAACDPHDSVGILDSYFPACRYFPDIERFDRHLEKLRRRGEGIDYLVVCSPNHLHDCHARLGLRLGADVICEKPLVLSPHNLDALQALEAETGRRVHPVLQLRCSERLQQLREQVLEGGEVTTGDVHGMETTASRRLLVRLTYVTLRGPWYDASWKGNEGQSGGLVTNIGIHLLDLLLWLFGSCQRVTGLERKPRSVYFELQLARADVEVALSVDEAAMPQVCRHRRSYRMLSIDGLYSGELEGFGDLHTEVYRQVLAGNGLSIADARPSLELAAQLRKAGTQ